MADEKDEMRCFVFPKQSPSFSPTLSQSHPLMNSSIIFVISA